MEKYIVQGGKKLSGTVKVSGSKNASLPILCATLLTDKKCTLTNVPDIADIHSMIELLKVLGCAVTFENNTVTIDPGKADYKDIISEGVCNMRASILLIGPLLARFGKAKMSFPGGCILGKRPVDAHLTALEGLGAEVVDVNEVLHLKADKLKGNDITMSEMSVTATENIIMGAVLAEGESVIRLTAAEPHVQDLCNFLNTLGAKIKGIGTHELYITGVEELNGGEYSITGDYLEAGTFAIASALTKGEVEIQGINPHHLDIVWNKFKELGISYTFGNNSVTIHTCDSLKAIEGIQTAVYPSFPTDLQAPFTVLLTQANGESHVHETLFEGRLNYLFELEKMGAKIEILNPHQAIIIGSTKLRGVPIASCDIRAGAAMVLAALVAHGKTEITNINYIDRGYENLDKKLRKLGASIKRL